MMTSNGLRPNPRLRIVQDLSRIVISLVGRHVSIDSNPMQLTTPRDLILTNDANIVLCLTSYHASIAARALVQVNRHTPFEFVAVLPFTRNRIDVFKVKVVMPRPMLSLLFFVRL